MKLERVWWRLQLHSSEGKEKLFFQDIKVRRQIDEVANEILKQSSSFNMSLWHHMRFCTDKETIIDIVRHLNVYFLWFRCLTKQESLSLSLYVPNTHTDTHSGPRHGMWGTSFRTLPAALSLRCRPPVGQPLATICIPLEPQEGCGAERMQPKKNKKSTVFPLKVILHYLITEHTP